MDDNQVPKEQELTFFDLDDYSDWKKEWKDMPEYIQNDLMPYQSIKVHFENYEDVRKFANLVNQNITNETQYIWFPGVDKIVVKDLRYIDES